MRDFDIDGFSQSFAGLEVRHPALRYGDAFAIARIATHARRMVADGKTAKATNFDTLTAHQRVIHRVQDGLDGEFGVLLGQLVEAAGQFFDDVRAGHREL